MHDILMVVGDLNTRVGRMGVPFAFHETTYKNGEKLLELAQKKSLVLCNAKFQKQNSRLWTHISPKGDKYQLDYILIRKKCPNSVNNAYACINFASICSGHQIVLITL